MGFPHGMSVKFGLWTFHKLCKTQKNFDFIDFWLPNHSASLSAVEDKTTSIYCGEPFETSNTHFFFVMITTSRGVVLKKEVWKRTQNLAIFNSTSNPFLN